VLFATIAFSFSKRRKEKRKKAVETANIKTGGNGGNPTTLTLVIARTSASLRREPL
jgi:hypothetical protein